MRWGPGFWPGNRSFLGVCNCSPACSCSLQYRPSPSGCSVQPRPGTCRSSVWPRRSRRSRLALSPSARGSERNGCGTLRVCGAPARAVSVARRAFTVAVVSASSSQASQQSSSVTEAPRRCAEELQGLQGAAAPRSGEPERTVAQAFSGNGRADLWRLAWDDARENPVLGAGSGTTSGTSSCISHRGSAGCATRTAFTSRRWRSSGRSASSCCSAPGRPLTALWAARTHPLVPGAAGAYVAYLVHTGVDWDWELPAVTLTGLLCGAAILIAARPSFVHLASSASARWTSVVVIVVAAGFAAVSLVGNTALSRSDAARQNHEWARAAGDARRAALAACGCARAASLRLSAVLPTTDRGETGSNDDYSDPGPAGRSRGRDRSERRAATVATPQRSPCRVTAGSSQSQSTPVCTR